MEDEYNALIKNNMWDLVPYSDSMNVVGNKWVFKLKLNPDDTIQRYKARLVAKSFLQTPVVDFSKTYSHVIKYNIVRVIITLAVLFRISSNLMLITRSLMVHFERLWSCTNLKGLSALLILLICADYIKLCMVLSKLLVPSLIALSPPCFIRSLILSLTLPLCV